MSTIVKFEAAGDVRRAGRAGRVARREEDAVEGEAGRRLGALVVARVLDVLQVQLARDVDVVLDVPDRLGQHPRGPRCSRGGLEPQPVSTAAASNAQASAALVERRRVIGARSLSPGRPRACSETRRLQRLEAGDGRARQRARREPSSKISAQALERRPCSAAQPAVHPEPLLERLARGAGLAPARSCSTRVRPWPARDSSQATPPLVRPLRPPCARSTIRRGGSASTIAVSTYRRLHAARR